MHRDSPCCNVLPMLSTGILIWPPLLVCGVADVSFREEIKTLLSGWKSLVAEAMKEELPVPAFSSALNYFYSLTSADLPANLVQAQRDYFGAHTFERKDELRGQFFHENWTGHGGDTKSGTYNV